MCLNMKSAPNPVSLLTTPVKGTGSTAGNICANWCNPHHFQSHCDNENCRECAFCPTESYKSCGAWCREGNGIYGGQCTDARCMGCAQCGTADKCTPVDQHDIGVEGCENWCKESTSRDHCKRCSCKKCTFCPKKKSPALAAITNPSPPPSPPSPPKVVHQPPPPPPPPVIDEKWYCYAQRYPDILQGYCNGVIEKCKWEAIQSHWQEAGAREGRELGCDTDSVRCYILRYPNLFEGYCGNKFERCAWEKILKHWAFHGYPSNLVIGCQAADTMCYVNRYPDILNGYCGGDVRRCDWEKILEHWAFHGREEHRDMGCTPFPPPNAPLAPPPPPPAKSPPPPPPVMIGGATVKSAEGTFGPDMSTFALPNETFISPTMTMVILGIVAVAGIVCVGAMIVLLRQGGRDHDLIDEPDELDEMDDEYYDEEAYYDEEEEEYEEPPKKSKKKKKHKRRSDYE